MGESVSVQVYDCNIFWAGLMKQANCITKNFRVKGRKGLRNLTLENFCDLG